MNLAKKKKKDVWLFFWCELDKMTRLCLETTGTTPEDENFFFFLKLEDENY